MICNFQYLHLNDMQIAHCTPLIRTLIISMKCFRREFSETALLKTVSVDHFMYFTV